MALCLNLKIILLDLIFICASISRRSESTAKCGYGSCNKEKPGMLNIHLIPHTHDDVGWLLTVDQYYYKEVQFILDSVIPELEADPSKRFIYVEIAFFTRWFHEQSDAMRHRIRRLVNEGRFEFILGGWCMNDEASTHYSAIIDQHKLGFEFLRHTFGECGRPKIGWQIDPFGHSREQASLFAQFGFDGLFFGRLDYQDKENRESHKTLEMVWRGSPNNLGSEADLFTGVLPYTYNPPPGYCWDLTCLNYNPKQAMIMDDPSMHDYNVEKMVNGFIAAMEKQAKWYATDHLIVPMGSDFNYIAAPVFFKEIDKLIKYVNARQAVGSKINLLYSTPSCYLKQLNNDNRTWTTKEDDFFPYADRPHGFWTGYFTSRPALKYYARTVNNQFQALKQMAALGKLNNTHKSRKQLNHLAQVLAVNQHHDAISGTAKQAVTFDYAERLADGVNKAKNVMDDVYSKLMPHLGSPPPPVQVLCSQLNISQCAITETSKNIQVTLYNPLARKVEHIVRVPLSVPGYAVLAEDGSTKVPCDIFSIDSHITAVHQKAKHELVFSASLPALGYQTFFIQVNNSKTLHFKSECSSKESNTIEGKYIKVQFDSRGNLLSIIKKKTGVSISLTQEFLYYEGHEGNNTSGEEQASGAYIFRPESNTPEQIPLSTWAGIHKGVLVQEARQQFSDWITQVFRVYQDKAYLEVEWTVGPVPIGDKIGKEVVTRYNIADWNNKLTFFTDSNGREILPRILNQRPTWNLNQTEPVAGNYYPVNALIAIKDSKKNLQMTVLTDRSQGGTSLHSGDIELMLHRRLLVDDGKGVGEPLNEPGVDGKGLVVKGRHYLLLDSIPESASAYRPLAQEVILQPQISFTNSSLSPTAWVSKYKSSWSGLNLAIPPNVHLLTLEQFHYSGPVPHPHGTVPFLIRLEHFYEKNEDAALSQPVRLDLKNLFSTFMIMEVHELALGANIPIDKVKKLKWNTRGSSGKHKKQSHVSGATVVTLYPMEIITLQANVQL